MNNTTLLILLAITFVVLLIVHAFYNVYCKHKKIQEKKEAKLHRKLSGSRRILRATIEKNLTSQFEKPSFFNLHSMIKVLQAVVTIGILFAVGTMMFGNFGRNFTNQTINSTEAEQIVNITSELAKGFSMVSSFFIVMITIVIVIVPIIILLKFWRYSSE
jgi:hypothetical protein